MCKVLYQRTSIVSFNFESLFTSIQTIRIQPVIFYPTNAIYIFALYRVREIHYATIQYQRIVNSVRIGSPHVYVHLYYKQTASIIVGVPSLKMLSRWKILIDNYWVLTDIHLVMHSIQVTIASFIPRKALFTRLTLILELRKVLNTDSYVCSAGFWQVFFHIFRHFLSLFHLQ